MDAFEQRMGHALRADRSEWNESSGPVGEAVSDLAIVAEAHAVTGKDAALRGRRCSPEVALVAM